MAAGGKWNANKFDLTKITLEEAVKLWKQHRSDNLLPLLLNGAATKPEVKSILDQERLLRKNFPASLSKRQFSSSKIPKGKKKAKAKPSAGSRSGSCTMVNGKPTWLICGMKFVKVQKFRGKTYIDIREYYIDKRTMETKPGKKGITLNCEEYHNLKRLIPEIDANLP